MDVVRTKKQRHEDGWSFRVRPDNAPPIPGRRGMGPWWGKPVRHYGGGKYRDGAGYGKTYFIGLRNQRVIARCPIAKNLGGMTWYKHGTYLQRHGAQQGGRGLGFDAEENEVRMPIALAEWGRSGDPWLFKIMLSPEHAEHVDLQKFTRATMCVVERDLGQKIEWIAIDHHNTAHGHVHICLRSVDRNGQELSVARDYLLRGIAARASEVLTQELGYRLEPELERARQRALERDRFGMWDRSILMKLNDHQQVRDRDLTEMERARIKKLEHRGLAWERNGMWELAYRWKEKMKAMEKDFYDKKQEQGRTQERAGQEREKEERERVRQAEQQRRLVRSIDELEREQRRERGR